MAEVVEKKRYFKPEGFKGRGKGNSNYKTLKWKIILFDKDTNTFREGKYATKEQLIKDFDLDLTPDHIYRLATGKKVDIDKKKKDSSFLSKYGHIKIEKISEKQNL